MVTVESEFLQRVVLIWHSSVKSGGSNPKWRRNGALRPHDTEESTLANNAVWREEEEGGGCEAKKAKRLEGSSFQLTLLCVCVL